MNGSMNRRIVLAGLASTALTPLFPGQARANPFLWLIARFLFRGAARLVTRTVVRSSVRRAAVGVVTRRAVTGAAARATVGRTIASRGVSAGARKAASEGVRVSAKQAKWTKRFFAAGLSTAVDALVSSAMAASPMEEDGAVAAPPGAYVYEMDGEGEIRGDRMVRLTFENRDGVWRSAILDMYVYDLDSQVVEARYPAISVSLNPHSRDSVDIPLYSLPNRGRKVVVLHDPNGGGSVRAEVSEIMYVSDERLT